MTGISIVPFPPDSPPHSAAARRFNERLTKGGYGEFCFAEKHSSQVLPKAPDRATWIEYFLAVDEGPEVRGGYILRYQPWFARGRALDLVSLKLPVSEGVIDRTYAMLGVTLLQDAAQRAPSLYALGMGGVRNKLPRILQRLGWHVVEVPFFFRVCRAPRVLRQTKPMRNTALRARLCDAAALTGAGSLAFAMLQRWRQRPASLTDVAVTLEPDFGDWCDPIWRACHASYDWAGQRDVRTLPLLYANDDARYIRMHVRRAGMSIGWVLGLCTDVRGHKQFGDLRLASLVDGMAKPGDAAVVVHAATRHLESLQPDLIVSNQLHAHWQKAVMRAGFLSGPSNFALALSPHAYESLRSRGGSLDGMLINRGDGDGPGNL